jgi:hypothetical protein
MGILAIPLYIAPYRVRRWLANRLPARRFLERPFQIVYRNSRRIARRIIAATRIDQFPIGIEKIEVRRPQSTVGSRHILRFVSQIDPGEAVGFHSRDHVWKIVLWIRIGAIGINGSKGHALIGKSFYGRSSDFIRTRHVGTVIAGEKDDKKRRLGEIGQGIGAAIGSRQIEIRSARSKRQCKRHASIVMQEGPKWRVDFRLKSAPRTLDAIQQP